MSLLYTHREALLEDLSLICPFPQNEVELYFIYPKATFPLTFGQLKYNFDNRSDSTGLLLYLKTGFTHYAMEKRTNFEGKSLLAVHIKKVLCI